ncbi:MAG: CBS domain-containing protein [Bacteroidetes bacterium]|nr:CBS domain-containing protein [Bacteroidota bacterium]
MIVEKRMTRNPVTISPDTPVAEAQRIMRREKIHRLPVLNKKKELIGIVTEKDLLYASPSPATTLDIHEITYLLSQLTVSKVMKKQVLTIPSDTVLEEAARIMVDNDIGGLPIVDSGVLVGIITESDIFKVFMELFGARHSGLRVTLLIPDKPGEISALGQAVFEKGGDIISLGTFLGTDASNAVCTMKVTGLAKEVLVEALKPCSLEIIDIREV